jgi:acid phosphatase (class A)
MKTSSILRRNCLLAGMWLAIAAPLLAQDRYLAPGKPDVLSLLPAPPAAGSHEQAADLAEAQQAVKNRTPEEVAHGKAESDFGLSNFSPAIGSGFQSDKLPKTTALFSKVMAETKAVTDVGKKHWKRPRPYEVDPKLLEGEKETSFGYPSGHSTRATVMAILLADLYPDKRDAILAIGRQIGWDRVATGRHYETDVFAGRVLGQAIVRELYNSPTFELDFAAAKAEIDAVKSPPAAKVAVGAAPSN